MTGGVGTVPRPNMHMLEFSNGIRAAVKKLYPTDGALGAAVDAGWKAVGL